MEYQEEQKDTILAIVPADVLRSHVACFLSLNDLVNLTATCRYSAFGQLLRGHVLSHSRLKLTEASRTWCRRSGIFPGAKAKICIESINTGEVNGLALTELSKQLVAVSWGGELSVWACCPSHLFKHLGSRHNAHDGPIQAICAFPASDKVATAGRDGKIGIWNLANVNKETVIEREMTLEGHERSYDIRSLCVDTNRYLVSASSDKTVRIWNCRNGQCVRVIQNANGHRCLYVCTLVPSGNVLVAGRLTRDHSLLVYNTTSGACCGSSINVPPAQTYCMCDLGENDEFATGGEGIISIWGVNIQQKCYCLRTFSGRHVRQTFEDEKGMVTSLCRCARILISGGSNGSIHTWDIDNNYTLLRAVQVHGHYISALVVLFPDEKSVASGGSEILYGGGGVYIDAYS